MTVMEFFGCAFLAFGPPLAMFTFTIARDPIRIIILIASAWRKHDALGARLSMQSEGRFENESYVAFSLLYRVYGVLRENMFSAVTFKLNKYPCAFFWLLSLLLSSLLWFVVIQLKNTLEFGLVFSVLFQELFRFLLYKLLRRAEGGLKKVTDVNAQISNNKHVLAYVSGLGFGVMSGAFSLVNVLADAVGPGTMGLKGGSDLFFITSAATTLCFILLHTFWGVIFFSAADNRNYVLIIWVIASHMVVSCLTLLNRKAYVDSLLPAYIILLITGGIAFYVAGGTVRSLKACLKCKQDTLVISD